MHDPPALAPGRGEPAGIAVARRAVMVAARDRWSGDGLCVFCLQAYVVHLEVYCAECDRPVCPLCATRRAGLAARLCPECAGGAEPGEE